MQPLTIIKHGQVVNHAERGVSPCCWGLIREALVFQTPEHPFHDRIVITIALPTHTAPHPGSSELSLILGTGILTAAIRVMQEAGCRLSLPDGHVQRSRD